MDSLLAPLSMEKLKQNTAQRKYFVPATTQNVDQQLERRTMALHFRFRFIFCFLSVPFFCS